MLSTFGKRKDFIAFGHRNGFVFSLNVLSFISKKGIYFGFVFLKQINKMGWRIKMDRISLVFNAEKKFTALKD